MSKAFQTFTPRFHRLVTTAIIAAAMVQPLPLRAMAQSDDPFAAMDVDESAMQAVSLSATLVSGGAPMESGLTWRIFDPVPDRNGHLQLVASAQGGTQTIELKPGDYFINCTFGRASVTKRVTVNPTTAAEPQIFNLDAGGLVLNATLGDDRPADVSKLHFSVYAINGDNRSLVVNEVEPNTILRLRAGIYDIVSTYGQQNAEAQARLRVTAGEITEAKLTQKAAPVTLRLVAEKGSEAIADTAWTVIGASGDILYESSSAEPDIILAEGGYTAVARNKQNVFEKNFTVAPGPRINVELVLGEDAANMDGTGSDEESVD